MNEKRLKVKGSKGKRKSIKRHTQKNNEYCLSFLQERNGEERRQELQAIVERKMKTISNIYFERKNDRTIRIDERAANKNSKEKKEKKLCTVLFKA